MGPIFFWGIFGSSSGRKEDLEVLEEGRKIWKFQRKEGRFGSFLGRKEGGKIQKIGKLDLGEMSLLISDLVSKIKSHD